MSILTILFAALLAGGLQWSPVGTSAATVDGVYGGGPTSGLQPMPSGSTPTGDFVYGGGPTTGLQPMPSGTPTADFVYGGGPTSG